jgi:adenylate cyclase
LRGTFRLYSALVMLAFVICHLTTHGFMLVSHYKAEIVNEHLIGPWRTRPGTWLLAAAFVVHYANALWSIYVRRSLRLSRWEFWQLVLGLCIPVLLLHHVVFTRIRELLTGNHSFFETVLLVHWVIAPWLGVLQVLALVTVWVHACIGINFWLRTKMWYPSWRVYLGGVALLLPTVALAGYVSAGNQMLRDAAAPGFVARALDDARMTAAATRHIRRLAVMGGSIHIGLVALPFIGRAVRAYLYRRRRPPMLTHPLPRTMPILPGATVLETLRDNGIPHASVCGGRARCTTCRVHVTKGLSALAQPAGLEAKALARIQAPSGMRLACQLQPTADLSVTPALAADAKAADGTVRGGLEGSERQITVVFVDLRGSTTLGEAKMPYDVLYILNQFFYEMTQALVATRGHYSQFTGDGLMALYGLHATDPAQGAADAIQGAREMLRRVDQLNARLHTDLAHPLRIGVGIHFSEAIVGAMGPPNSQIITAIGDTVNTCARLEGLTKEYDCSLIVSRQAAEMAGLDVAGLALHEAPVKGRVEMVQFYALEGTPATRA